MPRPGGLFGKIVELSVIKRLGRGESTTERCHCNRSSLEHFPSPSCRVSCKDGRWQCRDAGLLGSCSLDPGSKICWQCTWFCWGRLAWHVLTRGARLLVRAAELLMEQTASHGAGTCVRSRGNTCIHPPLGKDFYTLPAEGIARVLRQGWPSCVTVRSAQ